MYQAPASLSSSSRHRYIPRTALVHSKSVCLSVLQFNIHLDHKYLRKKHVFPQEFHSCKMNPKMRQKVMKVFTVIIINGAFIITEY